MPEVGGVIKFDQFEVDLRAGVLRRNNRPVRLQNQVFRLLTKFLEDRGEVLTREQLRMHIWPSDVFVDFDNGLSAAVRKLRVVLGRPPGAKGNNSYIETVPRVGYRFISLENRTDTNTRRINSVAILPFTSNADSSDLDYLCEGMTEALIDAVCQIRGIAKVIARNSAYRFKARDPQEAGRELGVQAVVIGSVHPAGDHVLVRAELISTSQGLRLWGASYKPLIQELSMLPSTIALALRDHLGSKQRTGVPRGVSHRSTENSEAYRLYLRGRYFWAKRPGAGYVEKAIELFDEAVALDPAFALAHVGLADCYNTLGAWEAGVLEPAIALERGKAAASRALQLDSNLAEAHTSRGYCHFHYEWDSGCAEAAFKRAIELNPNYSHAHHWYSHLLVAQGRMKESLEHSLRIIELDPFDLLINSHLAWHYHMGGHYEEELEESNKLLEMEPNFHKAHYFKGLALGQLGSNRDAVKALEKSYQLSGSTFMLSALGHACAVAGDRDKAVHILGTLKDLSKSRYVAAYELGTIHVGLHEYEHALDCLERAYIERSGWIPYLPVDPTFAPLRSEPRFQRVLRSISNS